MKSFKAWAYRLAHEPIRRLSWKPNSRNSRDATIKYGSAGPLMHLFVQRQFVRKYSGTTVRWKVCSTSSAARAKASPCAAPIVIRHSPTDSRLSE